MSESHAPIPMDMKGLRACMSCLLVKTFQQFYEDGCENCPFLDLKEDRTRVLDTTTEYFHGLVSMTNPSRSWVSKWTRVCNAFLIFLILANNVPGFYTMRVDEILAPEMVQLLEMNSAPNLGKLSNMD